MTSDESEAYEPPDPETLEEARKRRAKSHTAAARKLIEDAPPYPVKPKPAPGPKR